MAVIQMQIQALLVEEVARGEGVAKEVGREGEAEAAKPQIFDGTSSKVAGFITACKLYIKMRIREKSMKGQI